jgi:tetratricopeptide (TPR) repeat protein
MVKKLQVIISICCICLLCLSACSNSDEDITPKVNLSDDLEEVGHVHIIDDADTELIDAYTYLTTGRLEEAVAAFTMAKSSSSTPNFMLEAGIGKVFFEMGDYISAQQAFEAAFAIDQNRDDVLYYLGEAYTRTDDYTNSTNVYLMLYERNPNDDIVFDKLQNSMRRNRDYNGLLLLYEKLIESADAEDEATVNTSAGKLIEAALLKQDHSLIKSLITRFQDIDAGPAMELGYSAYLLLMQGEAEAVQELLFDHANNKAMNIPYSIYFGHFNDYGEYEGSGILIGNDRLYFGGFSNNNPNGIGTGFNASTKEWDGHVMRMTQNETRRIEADWKDGAPEGNVLIIDEYFRYEGDVLYHYWKGVMTITIVDGLAQGEVWNEEHYEDVGRRQRPTVTYIKHVMEGGRSVPFEVATGRETVVTAYKAWFDNPEANARSTRETRCFCNFVINW